MSPMIPLAMFGWLPVSLGLFAKLRDHRAAIAGFLLAWMFLPQYSFPLPGLPDYTKVSAACVGILLGMAVFDSKTLAKFSIAAIDVPVVALCLGPFFTSVSNGLGAYDGLSAMLEKTLLWGVPWFIGRLYLDGERNLRDMVVGIFVGGLVYMPFCLFELAMSPRLHRTIYGFHSHEFRQARRAGGWRPVVFMQHGLMTAMWMTSASFCGIVMAAGGYFRQTFPAKWRMPLLGALGALLLTTVLCKSAGAFLLLLFATGVFFVVRLLRQRWPLLVLIAIPILYMAARGTGAWDAQNLVDAAARATNAERAQSLGYRIGMETILADHALKRPVFGWGRWRRSFVRNDEGEIVSVPDGLWILALGQEGIYGLTFLTATLAMPILLFLKRFPPETWNDPGVAALTALPILIGVFMIDNLLNNMFNPAFLLAGGGLASCCTRPAADYETVGEADATFAALPLHRTRAL
jgi:hypothetical protein